MKTEVEKARSYIGFVRDNLLELAKTTSRGRWHHNHACIVAKDPEEHSPTKFEGYVVALADAYSLGKPGLYGHTADQKRALANSRWIVAAEPKSVVRLIESYETLLADKDRQIAELQANS